jgi:BirA family biotin operon repressor/biotin-[acetyl-CoA-carboxylase] ligase
LDETRIRAGLGDDPFVTRLIVLESTDSTNEAVRRMAACGAQAGTTVVADRQTTGRGRLGRSWHSAVGLGLYVSVLLRPRDAEQPVTRWTLAAAVAACEACREVADGAVRIEWPNDLIWERKKLGGLLTETRCGAGKESEVVVGLGVNVAHRTSDFPPAIAARATSLVLAGTAGAVPARERLAAAYLRKLGRVAAALEAGDWTSIARRWESLAWGARGQRVRVRTQGSHPRLVAHGVTDGIASDGALRVRLDHGGSIEVRDSDAVDPLEG